MKILILGGGGAKGWYEIGALKRLIMDLGYQYDAIVGNSVGALIGALLAHHSDMKEGYAHVKEVFDKVTPKKVYKNWLPGGSLGQAIGFFFKKSIYNSKPLEKLVTREFDREAVRKSGKKFRCIAVDMSTGHLRTFDENYVDLKKAILASSSYPTFFKPVMIEGRAYTDGGIRDIVPTRAAIEMLSGEDAIVDIISTEALDIPRWRMEDKTVLEYFPRVLEIQSNELHREDIIAGYSSTNLTIRHFIRPRRSLGDGLDFSREHVEAVEIKGYEDACEVTEYLDAQCK